jgi:ribonucleoside-diphosphate reductase alpha chain
VFLTFEEIDQIQLLEQASIRDEYIDQGQSLNICVPAIVDPVWFSDLHIYAWKKGIRTMYYVKTSSVKKTKKMKEVKNQTKSSFNLECSSCEG